MAEEGDDEEEEEEEWDSEAAIFGTLGGVEEAEAAE